MSFQYVSDFSSFSVRLPEADDQSGRRDPEPVPLLLRAQAFQEEHGVAVDVVCRQFRQLQRRWSGNFIVGSRRGRRLPQLPRVVPVGQLGPPEPRRHTNLIGPQVTRVNQTKPNERKISIAKIEIGPSSLIFPNLILVGGTKSSQAPFISLLHHPTVYYPDGWIGDDVVNSFLFEFCLIRDFWPCTTMEKIFHARQVLPPRLPASFRA